jgi:hypothetical protein
MPTVKQICNTSGLALWSAHEHKVAELVGLRVDNRSAQDEKIELLDCFTTDSSKTNSTGATQAAEDFETYVASGKIRFQLTVPTLEAVSLGPSELKEVTFLGKSYVRGSYTTSDCVVVASYKLR